MGVTFDDTEKKFVFDFEHDGVDDIVSLTGNGYQVKAFGKCFYYGYEFSENVESSVRTAFIKYVKFTNDLVHGITKFRAYLWVEGQDVDCENSASGTYLRYDLKFSLDAINE